MFAPATEVYIAPLALKGLACESCNSAVKAALNDLDGIEQVDVDYAKRKAMVLYDPDRVMPQQLVVVITKAGYPVEVQSADK